MTLSDQSTAAPRVRRRFEMTRAQLATLLEACRTYSAQVAWETLGREMGFDHLSVEPVDSGTERHFTAEVVES